LVDRELRDEGLARSRRCRDDDRLALQDRRDRPDLKLVQRERVAGLKSAVEVEVFGADVALAVGRLQLLGQNIAENRAPPSLSGYHEEPGV